MKADGRGFNSRQLHHTKHRHILETPVCGGFSLCLGVVWCPEIRTGHLDAVTRALLVSENAATCLVAATLSMMDVERRKRSPVPKTKKSPAEPGLKWIRETRVSRGSKETTGVKPAEICRFLGVLSACVEQLSWLRSRRCWSRR